GSFQPQLKGADDCLVQVPFELPIAQLGNHKTSAAKWESGSSLKDEEFSRAEALALFDYLRKSKSNGFVVSLSGGADSAATACLVYLMVAAALKELGPEGFKAKLSHIPNLSVSADAKSVTRQLLA